MNTLRALNHVITLLSIDMDALRAKANHIFGFLFGGQTVAPH
jgi:hypothetical protein